MITLILTAFALCTSISASSADIRDPRFVFGFLSVAPESCLSASGYEGICYSSQDCANLAGVADGNCAQGIGTCCTFTRTCGDSTSFNNTLFTNPAYPTTETGPISNCELTVNAIRSDICQIRIDFLNFELAEPTDEGICSDDFMTITGGSSDLSLLCGYNTGQHMYIDVDPSFGSMKINVDVSGQTTTARSWQMNVSQITCGSENRAPSGCLQYFRESSGTVSSFNYVPSVSALPTATRQLANQNYGVCIRARTGYCSVTWTKPETEGNYHFTMTKDTASVAVAPGTPGVPFIGSEECPSDYVVIPDGEVTMSGVVSSADRFCGLAFPDSVRSSIMPFALYVKTDSVELPEDVLNLGFSLAYRQNACTSTG